MVKNIPRGAAKLRETGAGRSRRKQASWRVTEMIALLAREAGGNHPGKKQGGGTDRGDKGRV